MEVIEHVDPPRLEALERTVFGHAAPGTVIVTTPNAEHNVRFETLPAGAMRHRDHRFEWTRARVPVLGGAGGRRATATGFATSRSARTTQRSVPPTQMAVFTQERPGWHDADETVGPGAEPGRPGRCERLGQVQLRSARTSGRPR